MRKVYCEYNSETKSYQPVQITFGQRLVRMLKRGVFFFLVGGAGFFLFYWFFGSSESNKALSEENTQLLIQYKALSNRLDEAMEVMADIQQRDDNLYRVLLMADPVSSSIRNSGYGGTNRYEAFKDLHNAALVVATTQKMDLLAKQLYIQSQSFDEVVEAFKNHEDMLQHLPAIQPVSNKDLKRTASGYGYRIHPIYKTRIFHEGMDFSCDIGTPVYATADGKVVSAKWQRGYGYMVELDHGYGYRTRYAHLKKCLVSPGQKVVRGAKIADSGNSGRSTGPHVHYEVLLQGRPVNPANYYFMDLDADQYDQMIEIAENHGKVFD